jgi:hypothetical protein
MALSASALHLNSHVPKVDWGAAVWIFPYMIGMTIISYFGNFGDGGLFGVGGIFKNFWVGGQGDVNIWIMMLVNAAFSLVIYYLAVSQRLPRRRSTSTSGRSSRHPKGRTESPATHESRFHEGLAAVHRRW